MSMMMRMMMRMRLVMMVMRMIMPGIVFLSLEMKWQWCWWNDDNVGMVLKYEMMIMMMMKWWWLWNDSDDDDICYIEIFESSSPLSWDEREEGEIFSRFTFTAESFVLKQLFPILQLCSQCNGDENYCENYCEKCRNDSEPSWWEVHTSPTASSAILGGNSEKRKNP